MVLYDIDARGNEIWHNSLGYDTGAVLLCFAVNVKKLVEPCVQTLCALGIFGSYEGLAKCLMSLYQCIIFRFIISCG